MFGDEGRSLLEAGGRIEEADMVLRMLRVTITSDFDPSAAGSHGAEALALLHATGGAQAHRRAVRQASILRSVERFLLYEGGVPGVGGVLARGAALGARDSRRLAAVLPAGAPPRPPDRHLELQRRTPTTNPVVTEMLAQVQAELALIDDDIDGRYFAIAALAAVHSVGGAIMGGWGPVDEMNFAIRYVTRYRHDAEVVDNLNALRVRPAASGRQRVDEFSVRLSPEVRLGRHNHYLGTDVVEFEVSRPHQALSIDVRARVSTQRPAEPPASSWEALRHPDYREAAGEFLLQTGSALDGDAPGHPVLEALLAAPRAASNPLACVMLMSELIPDRFSRPSGPPSKLRSP